MARVRSALVLCAVVVGGSATAALADPFTPQGLTARNVTAVLKCQDALTKEGLALGSSTATSIQACGAAQLGVAIRDANGLLTVAQETSQQTSADRKCDGEAAKIGKATTRFMDKTSAACAPVASIILAAEDPLELLDLYADPGGPTPDLAQILGSVCESVLSLAFFQADSTFPSDIDLLSGPGPVIDARCTSTP